MPKRESNKDIVRHSFAQAYVENGFNGTKAMQAIKPHLTPASASVAASDLLKETKTVSAIESFSANMQQILSPALTEAIARLRKAIAGEDSNIAPDLALKLLKDYAQLFAPANTGPKTAVQNNKYVLPKV